MKKTFWPYGILLSLFAVVVACAVTIYLCLDYPVYTDDSYFTSYQNVENNFTDIQERQAEFEKNVKFNPQARLFCDGEPSGEFHEMKLRKQDVRLSAANSACALRLEFDSNASPRALMLLTRPDSAKFDVNLDAKFDAGKFTTNEFRVPKPGRWQVKIKLSENNESVAFYDFEFFIK